MDIKKEFNMLDKLQKLELQNSSNIEFKIK